MEEQNTRIVEIGGVKVECDLRTAKQVETFKVGDPVKLLIKEYGETYSIKYGVIVDFANFKDLPSIVVAYLDGWENTYIKFAHINEKSEDYQIAPCARDEISIDRFGIEREIDNKIKKLGSEIEELEETKRIFKKRFGEIFKGYKDK